ncbi:16S rRNA (guanine(527)-N(7))-methyltransferase RsmG [Demequina salsinemoris]|uniref:16S rRNA (guanine(527)-N(7))-methyltransferase RsmG n=1 Tax=Demequina salsinemoris TaxID=577470 RepID=UPI0007857634|nr:16S rRNA (guanine(527)-N(7))-methyltransferase RsmG [Demequina salsinemoris]
MSDVTEPLTADEAPRGLQDDPLEGTEAIEAYFGEQYPRVRAFAELLADQGVLRGLIGPRELERVWERHILNSAAVVPFLGDGVLVDVGSGAGLPGMVVAAMQPERRVVLVEPMERRVQWLLEASRAAGIDNVTMVRGRAEEVAESVEADIITARAVASIDKLVKWCMPLLSATGEMVLLKGRSAQDELDRAKYVLRKNRLAGEVLEAPTLDSLEPTRVVRLTRQASR